MTTRHDPSVKRSEVVRRLRELVEALDQRVPHVDRLGEAAIALDAASLRDQALRRIAQLEAESETDMARVGQ
jgi:hypothetical protein